MLAGYYPYELLLGRLLFLELFGLVVVDRIQRDDDPRHRPRSTRARSPSASELVALTSVPFGLAVGALVPHELEGVLILIGVVGVQLTLADTEAIAKLLPFWGPQRLIGYSVGVDGSIGIAPLVAVAYSLALLGAAAYIVHRRAPAIRAVGSLSSIT